MEGIRAVEELLATDLVIRGALTSAALETTERGASLRRTLLGAGVEVLDVTDAELDSAADTDTPQGVLAVAEQPASNADAALDGLTTGARLLVLDGIQDPGNAGTIVRTAAALGAAGVLALPGTVDLWSPKVVRAAMGALFRLPIAQSEWAALDAGLARLDAVMWGADALGARIATAAGSAPARLAVAIGNEGAGLSSEARARVARIVSIPISPTVESLNAGIATGILLYELRPAALRP